MTKQAADASGATGSGLGIPVLSPRGACQKLTSGAASTPSAVFAAGVTVVRIIAKTNDIHYAIGPAPVASDGGGPFLAKNVPEYVQVCPNDKIAVIQDSAGGVVYLVECL